MGRAARTETHKSGDLHEEVGGVTRENNLTARECMLRNRK